MKKILALVLAMMFLLSGTMTAMAYVPMLDASPSTSALSEREIENAALTRLAGAEGAVLLKNDNATLPLKSDDKVAIFGTTFFNTQKGGLGSGDVRVRRVADIYTAIKQAEDAGAIGEIINDDGVTFTVDELGLSNFVVEDATTYWAEVYDAFVNCERIKGSFGGADARGLAIEPEISDEEIQAWAKEADKAVIAIGRVHGEGTDRVISADRSNISNYSGQYSITEEEEALFKKVSEAFHAEGKQVAVVLNVGATVDTAFVEKYGIDAVLLATLPGQEAGYSITDVLTGAVNPSGKLVDTMAKSIYDYPSTMNVGDIGESGAKFNVYAEGIYVGYRYFETFNVDVNFEFGFGLSYTTFDIAVDNVAVVEDKIQIDATVTNTGDVAGKEVVQVYFNAPDGDLEKASKELIAFAKTEEIAAGASQSVSICFDIVDMNCYSEEKAAYILEDGAYNIFVGNSVKNVENVFTYEVAEEVLVEQLTNITPVLYDFEELSKYGDELLPKAYTDGYDVTTRQFVPGANLGSNRFTDAPVEAEEAQYKLLDVYNGTVSMEEFIAQAEVGELIGITAGGNRYANSGNASTKESNGAAGQTSGIARLGIPSIVTADGPAGVRINFTGVNLDGTEREQNLTAFPSSTCLAQTWDPALAEKIGAAYGVEMDEYDIDLLLSPGMNIHRNPLGARNFEYYSEDPLITGVLCGAFCVGVQSEGPGVTIKHYAANNQEINRQGGDSVVTERTLREIYLEGFRIVVQTAKPMSVMCSYNRVNGIFAGQSYDLMTTVLRDEWGFDGFAMTDWGAKRTAFAGVDLGMPNANEMGNYLAGLVSADNLRTSAARICEIVMKTKAFADYTGIEYVVDYEAGANEFEAVVK